MVPRQTIQIIVFQTSTHILGRVLKARTSTEAQRPFTVTYQERTCIFKSLTWRQEEAASGFVQAVAGERCGADDDEAAKHHGHDTDQHEDAPEAPVNCTSEAESATRDPLGTAEEKREVLTDGRVVFGGVVRLLRDGEREEVGMHAHFGVRLVDWRHTGENNNQLVCWFVRRPAAEQISALCFWLFSCRLVRHVNMWNSTEPHKVPLSELEAVTRLSVQARRHKSRTRHHLTVTRITSHGLSGHMRWPHSHTLAQTFLWSQNKQWQHF